MGTDLKGDAISPVNHSQPITGCGNQAHYFRINFKILHFSDLILVFFLETVSGPCGPLNITLLLYYELFMLHFDSGWFG